MGVYRVIIRIILIIRLTWRNFHMSSCHNSREGRSIKAITVKDRRQRADIAVCQSAPYITLQGDPYILPIPAHP